MCCVCVNVPFGNYSKNYRFTGPSKRVINDLSKLKKKKVLTRK